MTAMMIIRRRVMMVALLTKKPGLGRAGRQVFLLSLALLLPGELLSPLSSPSSRLLLSPFSASSAVQRCRSLV